MKNHKNVFFTAILALLVAAAASCMTAKGGGVVLNFIKISGVDWSYESSTDGAQLLLRNLVVRFANDTGDDAEAKILVEWGNGRTEESSVTLPETGGKEYTEVVWEETRHGDHFVFHGEMTVTIKMTIRFLETVSPVFEKTMTLRSL